MPAVKGLDLGAGGAMVLAAACAYLERAHKRSELPGRAPIHAFGNAIQQTGAISIAASRRIDDILRFNARNFQALTPGMNLRALRAVGHDQGLHSSCQIRD